MILLTYDIQEDKLRTQLSKFLISYGRRIQYSVFEIDNSKRVLEIVKSEIKNRFEKKFGQSDSVMIFHLSNNCQITRYGYAKNEESNLVFS